MASVAPKDFSQGIYIVISRSSFRSLIDSYLNPESDLKIISETKQFTVKELEDLIEGYSNTFRLDATVETESYISGVSDLHFDSTFGNVAFKMTQRHEFKNPFKPEYLSAKVMTAAQCVLNLRVNEKMDLVFEVEVK